MKKFAIAGVAARARAKPANAYIGLFMLQTSLRGTLRKRCQPSSCSFHVPAKQPPSLIILTAAIFATHQPRFSSRKLCRSCSMLLARSHLISWAAALVGKGAWRSPGGIFGGRLVDGPRRRDFPLKKWHSMKQFRHVGNPLVCVFRLGKMVPC